MGQSDTIPRSFRQKLRNEIDQRGLGVRTLARTMAERSNTPARVESIRRQLKRYLSEVDPVSPTAATRHSIEDALGLERDSLTDDEDSRAMPSFEEFIQHHVERALKRQEVEA
jgi:ribosome-binding protein aMBF1 (putative translation factor)